MLKKLTPMHNEAIRRLVVGESPQDVADELGVTKGTVTRWLNDPKFLSELHALEERANNRLTENQETAFQIIQSGQSDAARNCREAVKNGTIKGMSVSEGTILKASWDLLDRGGHKAVEKREVDVYDLADLIRIAEEREEKLQQRQAQEEDVVDAEYTAIDR